MKKFLSISFGLFFSFLINFPFTLKAQDTSLILQEFLGDSSLTGALVGVHVTELETGKEIQTHNKNKLFIPASTLKTLYVFETLEKYGENFRYETSLSISGPIQDNILRGDLIIRASGDPSLGGKRAGEDFRDFMDSIVSVLKAHHISRIQGNLILQLPADIYPAHGSWPIEDIGNYYGSGSWGFNFNDNTYYIYLRQKPHPGQKVEIERTEPVIPGLVLISKVTSGPKDSGDNAYIYGDPMTYYRTIFGTIPAGEGVFRIKGAIPNPPKTFLRLLKPYLQQNGIRIDGRKKIETTHQIYPDEKKLWIKKSAPLEFLAQQTLNFSINHYSEAFARLLIQGSNPQDGYLPKDSINNYFHRQRFQLIDLEDGSGLAPDNLIAPSEFTRYFRKIYHQKGLTYLQKYLPHAGEDGYAKYFLKNSPVQSRIWLKSGSVSKVQNYVGIFRSGSGKYYAFAIMVNHFSSTHTQVKKAIENYLQQLVLKL